MPITLSARFAPIIRLGGAMLGLCLMGTFAGCSSSSKKHQKPNILILSFCSLRQDHLSPYGYERLTTPHLLEFSKKAFIFTNGFNGTSWTNASAFLQDIPRDYFAAHGYVLPGVGPFPFFHRIPSRNSLEEFETGELRYGSGFEELKHKILERKERPFFLYAHIKYLHFPYFDQINEDFDPNVFLSERSKVLLAKYRSRPEDYPDKFPLLSILFRDQRVAMQHPKMRVLAKKNSDLRKPGAAFGLINHPEFLEKWQKSAEYVADIELIKELYDAKLRYLDSILADVLNLYGDKNLQENTVIVVTGDHGESLMEHGSLIHGDSVFDEVLRFPLIVRFPKSSLDRPRVVDAQIYQAAIRHFVEGLTQRVVFESNFESYMKKFPGNSGIVARNCMGTKRALRYQNQWKLTVDEETRERKLFDLIKDPAEQDDVYERNPEVVGKLEELLFRDRPPITMRPQLSCAE